MEVVVDTNILIKACNSESLDCIAVLAQFYQNDSLKVAVDVGQSIIVGEYRQNLIESEFYQKWYYAICESNQVVYKAGKLDIRIKDELNRRKFHEPTDQAFVAVALESDRIIITEDSDYGKGNEDKAKTPEKQEVLRYMTDDLTLQIMDSKEGLSFVRRITP